MNFIEANQLALDLKSTRPFFLYEIRNERCKGKFAHPESEGPWVWSQGYVYEGTPEMIEKMLPKPVPLTEEELAMHGWYLHIWDLDDF